MGCQTGNLSTMMEKIKNKSNLFSLKTITREFNSVELFKRALPNFS